MFDLRTGEKLAQGLVHDERTVATPEGEIISASASRLSRSSADLDAHFALAKSGVAPVFMQVAADTLLLSGYDGRITLYDLQDGRKLGGELPSISADMDYLSAGIPRRPTDHGW